MARALTPSGRILPERLALGGIGDGEVAMGTGKTSMGRQWFCAWLALLFAAMAGPGLAMPPVWTLRDADSEIVIFGSVHVLPEDLDWRPLALRAALEKAQDVWFELPMDPATQSQISQLALAKGLLPDGVTLSQQLSPQGRERLGRVSARAGVNPGQLERFRPWLAEASLAVANFQAEGAHVEDGVERSVFAALRPDVQRRAFETPEQQIGYLSGTSPEEQLASLEDTLRQMDEDPGAYQKLLKAWMAGDVSALERDALDPLRRVTPGLYGVLIRDRNARWVRMIKQRAAGKGRTVIIVGVGHLLGADGVPERLRRQGYRVEGP